MSFSNVCRGAPCRFPVAPLFLSLARTCSDPIVYFHSQQRRLSHNLFPSRRYRLHFSMMSDFPHGGDIEATRAWLDKEGYVGLFNGWEADTLLGTFEEDVRSKFESSPEDQERADSLWGLLDTARRSSQWQAGKNYPMMQASNQATIKMNFHPVIIDVSTLNPIRLLPCNKPCPIE